MAIQQAVASKAFTVFSLSMIMLLPDVSLAAEAYQLAMRPETTVTHDNSRNYCSRIRLERQQQINRNSDITLETPLWQSGESRCFIPAENLYYIALILGQDKIESPKPWYDNIKKTLNGKAVLACEVMGYGEDNSIGISSKECVRKRLQELIKPYENEYQKKMMDFISQRNQRAEDMVHQCVIAFYRSLPSFPNQIKFPLAYYDMKIDSYPAWYLKNGLDNFDRLEGVRDTRASDVVKDALSQQCPSEMIFWLYLPSE
ncbi:MAG: hypothetical protein KAG53_11640 [Endozoicomonadaceae bacterium]|nr:hypothetical protein [Endozoicomonadaceae bacterium]